MNTQIAEQTAARGDKRRNGGRMTQPSAPVPVPVTKAGPSGSSTVKQVNFSIECPKAKKVLLAGSFNNWDGAHTPMRREGNGKWKATVRLAPGRYEYRFVVDGEWQSDPAAAESAPNNFGTANSVVVVSA